MDAGWATAALLLLVCAAIACGQTKTADANVTVTVVDENGQAVEGAQVTIAEPGAEPAQAVDRLRGKLRIRS